jgi:hypothetical protein
MWGIEENLLVVLLAAQASVLLVALCFMFGHAVWGWLHSGRHERAVTEARAALIDLLDEAPESYRRVERIKTLPLHLQITLFAELAPSLSGLQRRRLTSIASDVGLVEEAAHRCLSRFWWRRLQGARLLTLIGGGEDVVPSLFRDRRFEVRAQAAEWAAEHPDPEIIEGLLDLLQDPQSFLRFTVQDSLLRLGSRAVEVLADRLQRPDLDDIEVTSCLRVAAGVVDPRFLGPALSLCSDQREEVRTLAAAVIGSLGGDDVTDVLTEMLSDESAAVRAAACKSLGKLSHWPAAAGMARLMRDRAWVVRREAALGLREIGMPGILMLRRSLKDEDRFAADMAKQVLDLPDTVAGLATYDAV